MKTKLIGFCLVVGCSVLSSCYRETIRVSNAVTTEQVRFSDYTGLRVSSTFNAYVTISESEEKIEIEANENLHDKIIVAKEGDDLIVRLKNNTNLRGNVTLNVYISTKNLVNFEASGASDITLQNQLVTENAAIRLSGASNFHGELNTGRLNVYASGASSMDVFGSTYRLDADLSGSSTLRDYDLVIQQLDIELSGASDAFLSVQETIDIKASGASTLNYKGDAVIGRENLSGASEINRR